MGLMYFKIFLLGCILQALICILINMYLLEKRPSSILEFIKLTFLPWVLFNVGEIKKEFYEN